VGLIAGSPIYCWVRVLLSSFGHLLSGFEDLLSILGD
jgi:hypothetical protein